MNVNIQLTNTIGGSVLTNQNVIFENVSFTSGDVSYNSTTGVITLNKAGIYLLKWFVSTQASKSTIGTVFSVVGTNINPTTIIGNSPIKTGETTGIAVISVETVPAEISLVNESGQEVWYSTINPVKASLVVESHDELENLDDGDAIGSLIGIGAIDDEFFDIGEYAVALGYQTAATGNYSFAEGNGSVASGEASHAEGQSTSSYNTGAHSEGIESNAGGSASHAEGYQTRSSGDRSHAEGYQTNASGEQSHAEGYRTIASAFASHAEGSESEATIFGAHAEGSSTKASGTHSHAEGSQSIASANYSHAEGWRCSATDIASHAQGQGTIASGNASHAQNTRSVASGVGADATGYEAQASGNYSHTEGLWTIASSDGSHAEGLYTEANHYLSHIMGQFGKTDTTHSWFLANGNDQTTPGLSAKILNNGNAYIDIAWNTGGADYAEMFETIEGITIEPGYFITVAEGEKVTVFNSANDTYILGISSATPGFIGDVAELRWAGKFEVDEWNRIIYEEVEVPTITDPDGTVIVEAHTEIKPKINALWDKTKSYISRKNRPEWISVGLLGKLLVRDDGSCIVGGYCMPNENGIATTSETGYKVIKRIGTNQIKIILK